MFTDVLLNFSFDGPPSRSFAMVKNVLAFGQRNLTLDYVVLQVNARGDEREAPLQRAPGKLVDFLTVQKQAPVPKWVVVKTAARRIGADVAIDQPSLAVLHHRVTVFQIDLALTNRFYFRPRQFHTALEPFQQMIEMLRLAVNGKVSWGRFR